MPEITQEQLDAYTKSVQDAKDLEVKIQEKDKEIENVRMEVLTPEYTAYLDSLGKDGDKDKDKEKEKEKGGDDEFSKLTPKQIYDRAVTDAVKQIEGKQTKVQEEAAKTKRQRVDKEIADFAKEHDDFATFKPIMYGLSLDPKFESLTLDQLYDKAKDHVARISGVDPKKKKEGAGKGNEKPGGGGSSYEKIKTMSNEAISKEALEEVKSELGSIPSA